MLRAQWKPHRANLRAHSAAPQRLFTILQVIPETDAAQERPPIAIALVIDTSGSMREYADREAAKRMAASSPGQAVRSDGREYLAVDLPLQMKLDYAVEGARALIEDERLRPDDMAAVIKFDDEAITLAPLQPVGNRTALRDAVERLRQYEGGTLMGAGMALALEELSGVSPSHAKRLVLFTDGETFDEDKCRVLAPLLAESNTPIIAIGIGSEYNEDLMMHLADATSGRPYHLASMEEFSRYLSAELEGAVREVITDLSARVASVKGVKLTSAARVYPSLAHIEVGPGAMLLGNIPAGDHTVFLLEFDVAGVGRPPSRARIAQLVLTGRLAALNQPFELGPLELWSTFTTDEQAVAVVDPEVMAYVQQSNVSRMVEDAVSQARTSPARARQTLQVAMNLTQRMGNRAVTQMLQDAARELDATGTISAETVKTVRVGGRTRTVKAGATAPMDVGLTEEEIRRLTEG